MIKILESLKNIPLVILNNIPFNLKKFLPKWLQKEEEIKDNFIIKDILDPTKTREEKIKIEKRKRNQIYTTLNYLLALNTYFDFFSSDTFKIAKYAKYLAQISKRNIVTSDFLILAFFYTDSEICKILKKHKIEKNVIQNIIKSSYNQEIEMPEKISIFQKIYQKINNFFNSPFEEILPDPTLRYSLEVNKIFQKASENAMKRFKTPVISTEILLITLLEDKNTKGSKIINQFLKTETDWLLFRYDLIKRLFKHESTLKRGIPKNQHFFAYLLKIRLSDNEFERLIEDDYFQIGVSLFRNQLVKCALETNIYDLIEKDIAMSMKANFYPRTYST